MIKRLLRDERGQAIALMAVMMTASIAMVALALDAGNAYFQRRLVQRSCDLAVRAVSYQVATASYSNANSTGYTYAHNNGVPGTGSTNVTIQYSADATTYFTGTPDTSTAYVRIICDNPNFNTFFLGIVGRDTLSANARTTTIVGAVGTASCANLFPAVVNGDTDGDGAFDADFTLDTCYIIRDDNASPGGGSFGWVDLNGGGGGASELAGWIESYASGGDTGCDDTISVGTASAELDTETGNKASLQDPILEMITGDTNGDGVVDVNPPHNEVTVAIYDAFGNNDDCDNGLATGSGLCYRVKGFGRFRLTDVWISGNSNASPSPDNAECDQVASSSAGPATGFDTAGGSSTTTFTGTVNSTTTEMTHTFTVSTTGTISATLSGWTGNTTSNNPDLYLLNPSGSVIASATTTNRPETLSAVVTTTGTYTLVVERVAGTAAYSLAVTTPLATGYGTLDNADSKGILGKFIGWVDPTGTVSTAADGPAKAVNIIE
ncbi:MAG: Tad protein [Dehalococcoidia bacterium]|nr:Tad protein [Dehalococcoidia bacterium]